MTQSWRGLLTAIAAAGVTAACQTSLRSDLPSGAAGYAALSVPEQPGAALSAQLQPGDEIGINVYQEPDLSPALVVIDTAGNASLPLIGEIGAAGLSTTELAHAIERAYGARYLRDPKVNVVLLKSAPRVVSVEGAVDKPGVYPIQQGYTLLSALALAGSPTGTAKLDEVLVFRQIDGAPVGARFNLNDIRAGRFPDPQVLPRDSIVVGYSAVRGIYQDFLKSAPLFGVFARY